MTVKKRRGSKTEKKNMNANPLSRRKTQSN